MMRVRIIIIILFFSTGIKAQVNFRTIVPQQSIIAGESFQVQYVLEDVKKSVNINPPPFAGFRFVTGPNGYSGTISTINGSKPVYNVVYTLEAVKPGKFDIPGAAAIINGKIYRSNDVSVEVISQQEALKRVAKEFEATNSEYFLRPGEDVYKKIRENLFLKVSVDKKSCYTGEPLLATFKLYSRLESKSDIIKNPGFYGFTVYDMVNLEDHESTVEKINGKSFDVHTIRKVQLFPLQAGLFTIDAMEVKNRIEFSKTAVSKKTEQEIVEGVLHDEDEAHSAATEVYETTMHTEPVTVSVKPVPEKNRPASWNGAVGQFTIEAKVPKKTIGYMEQGRLEITISGKGNFVQLDAPELKWPEGIEGLSPAVVDNLDKSTSPLSGSRTFAYTFYSNGKIGNLKLEPVSISFFDNETGSFKTSSTDSMDIQIIPLEIKKVLDNKDSPGKKRGRSWDKELIILAIALLVGLYLRFKKGSQVSYELIDTKPADEYAAALFEPVRQNLNADGRDFYIGLNKAIWHFFSVKFDLYGSQVNKIMLAATMRDHEIGETDISELIYVLSECETGIFTGTSPEISRSELLTKSEELIQRIYNQLP
jgi:hypothetical protein